MDVKMTLKIHLGEHIPSDSTILSFKTRENKHNVFRGKYCMKRFCE